MAVCRDAPTWADSDSDCGSPAAPALYSPVRCSPLRRHAGHPLRCPPAPALGAPVRRRSAPRRRRRCPAAPAARRPRSVRTQGPPTRPYTQREPWRIPKLTTILPLDTSPPSCTRPASCAVLPWVARPPRRSTLLRPSSPPRRPSHPGTASTPSAMLATTRSPVRALGRRVLRRL